jgi:uncharacterized protein (TIGR02145 family)
MNGTHVVVENLLPAAPTVFNGSRNCPGTVTLTASSSPAAVIDWYVTVDAASSVHTGTSYTTPEIDESTTFYVQARFENTGCLSERVPVLATVITENCCHAPGTTVNFTTFNPCAAAAGATWALVDTREANLNPANPQTYTAKKMADGHIWLVQDLKFGNLCGITFSGSSGGNQTGKVSNAPGTYYGDCTAATNTSTPSARGYMYDWAAAINKSGAYYGSSSNVGCSGTLTGATGTVPGACQGICPAGWHIPTGGSSGEFKALHNAQGCATNNDNCWDASSAWQGTYNGWTASNGSLVDGGSYGFYWSSTYGSANNAYMLAYRSNKTMVDVYNGSDCCNGYKYYGWGVRCVMNY